MFSLTADLLGGGRRNSVTSYSEFNVMTTEEYSVTVLSGSQVLSHDEWTETSFSNVGDLGTLINDTAGDANQSNQEKLSSPRSGPLIPRVVPI